MFLKIFKNAPVLESLFNKVAGPNACNFIKNRLTQVFSCQICEIFQNTYLEEHLRTTASKHRSSFLEVFCRSCCSASFNAVMKHSFSAAVVQSWKVLHGNLLKTALHHRYFSKNFTTVSDSDIEKCICMAVSEDEFILETFLHGCFSKTAAGVYSF